MVNDLNTLDQTQQSGLGHPGKRKNDREENQFPQGSVVFKKDTGMAFQVVKMSHANGIEHFNVVCAETGSSFYLSRFALEKDYTHEVGKIEKVGLRMVKRLSEMWGN